MVMREILHHVYSVSVKKLSTSNEVGRGDRFQVHRTPTIPGRFQVHCTHPQNNHKTRGGWVEGGLVPDTLPPFTPMKCKRLPLTSKSGSSLGRLITTAKTTKLHKIFNASKVKIDDGTGVLASLGF